MSESSSTVLVMVLKLIDKYNLYGQVAYPKHHKQSQVPDIYCLAAKTKVLIYNASTIVSIFIFETLNFLNIYN